MKIFITTNDFIDRFRIGKTKTHELINEKVLTTGKVGTKTLILNSSALAFAAKALEKGNLGKEGAQEFLEELREGAPALCHTHSSDLGVQIPSGIDEKSAIPATSRMGSPEKILKGNHHG